jgi:hypothetical protein
MTLKNAGPISISRADQESEIVVGRSRSAPDLRRSDSRCWRLPRTLEGEEAVVGDATTDGDAATDGDTDAVGLPEPQALMTEATRTATNTQTLRLSTARACLLM